jgi:hypothetical protein
MNKRNLLLWCIVVVSGLSAVVQDLPDIEISGPSPLKSTLEKKGLFSSELYIPDVVDSLQPIIPQIVPIISQPPEQKLRAVCLDLSNRGFHSKFIANEFIFDSLHLSASAGYQVPKNSWSQFYGKAGIIQNAPYHTLGLFFDYLNNRSPKNIKYQSDSSINLNYDFNNILGISLPCDIWFDSEFHYNQYRLRLPDKESERYYWNNSLQFRYSYSGLYEFVLGAAYTQKTPVFSVNASKIQSEPEESLDFLRGLSLYATDNRVVPGVYLSKRFMPFNDTSVLLYQESKVRTHDISDLLLEQPWQYGRDKSIVSFNPLNSHLIVNNKSLSIAKLPLNLSGDMGIGYYVDEPTYSAVSIADDLPVAKPENILQGNLDLSCRVSRESLSFTQSVKLDKGWLAGHSYSELSYLPLFSLESVFGYQYRGFDFAVWLNQFYNTIDDNTEHLRESVDLGAKVDYRFKPDIILYGKLSNLLNKGKYVYRTLPVVPASVLIGFEYYF